MARSFFSSHGRDNLDMRVGISEEVACVLLDARRYVPIRKEEGSEKVHKLAYIREINDFCVFVQDEANGEVVTVLFAQKVLKKNGIATRFLPKVTFDRAIAVACSNKLFDLRELPAMKRSNPESKLRISVQLHSAAESKSVLLTGVMTLEGITNVDCLIQDDAFRKAVGTIVESHLAGGSYIEHVCVKVGSRKNSAYLDWF